MIGSSNKQFRRLIFYENSLISISALICGIILGLVFSKFFLMMAETMIDVLNLDFYFPVKAILYTLILMGGLFLTISLLAPIILRKKKVIQLLKKEDEAEKNYILIISVLVAIVVPILIYNRNNESLLMYPLYLVSFILISYFIFNVIFVAYAFMMKRSRKMFKGSGLIKVSNFNYYIHTNLKTMTISMVLFSITLIAFIYIIGAPKNVELTTQKILPYSHMYSALDHNVNDQRQADKIKDTLQKEPGFKSLKIDYLKLPTQNRDVLISNSTYQHYAQFMHKKPIHLTSKDYYMVGTDGKHEPMMGDLLGKDLKELGITEDKGRTAESIALSGFFTSVTVISDEKYEALTSKFEKDRFFAFHINNWKTYNDTPLKEKLGIKNEKDTLASASEYYSSEKLQRSIIAYVGSVLCISFLIGIASITYSRLYSSAETEIKKYQTMVKLGVTQRSIQQALASTVQWIFVLPFLIALIVTWSTVIYLNQYTFISYYKIAMYCSFIYFSIEMVLYFIIKRKYQNKIFKSLYHKN